MNRSFTIRRTKRAFSLMELMVSLTIAAMVLGLGFTGLSKAKTAGNSRGLATAVAAEMRYAREKAIASGSPVAVVFPPGVGRSLFWLEGTTDPVVTRTSNFEGDYPTGGITVATYPGPNFQKNASMPGFKAKTWGERLDSWLPDRYKDHFVIFFAPNGSVLTNDLPSAEGTYRVIVGTGGEVTPTGAPSGGNDWVPGNDTVYYALRASGEPYTVAVSLSGSVEYDKGLAGWSGSGIRVEGAASPSVARPPNPPNGHTAKLPKIIYSRITPPAEILDDRSVHVLDKGEYLTLEVFAQSQDGKPLFAGWADNPLSHGGDPNFKGRFSVPNGALERMEFYPQYDADDDGVPEKDVWRSVWTWTPPSNAEPGDNYSLEVDVKDSKQELSAKIDDIPPVTVAPPGEIVFERRDGGRWHLFTMWADGSRLKKLTDGPHNFRCASVTADGKLLAFERDGNQVWVMNTDGTGEVQVATGKTPAISPTGSAIAYMNGNQLTIKRLDVSGTPTSEGSSVTVVAGAPDPSNRPAFSPDGRWVYYTSADRAAVEGAELAFPGNNVTIVRTRRGANVPNIASTAMVGGLSTGRGGELYYHADQNDPYIGLYATSGGEPQSVGSWRTSVNQNETFPAISPRQDLLLFCQEVGGVYQIYRSNKATWTSSGVEQQITFGEESLRPAWIMQRGPF